MAEEQREQKQGFFSKVIDGANSGYNTYRNTRMATKVGKRLGKQVGKKLAMQGGRAVAAEGAGLLFTNPVGWIILGIGLVLVIVVIVLFGGISGVKGGDLSNIPSPSPSAGPPGTTPTCTSGDIAACLKNDFNITVTNGTTAQMNDIYNIFALPFSYPLYKQLITNGGGYLNINLLSDNNGCHGWTSGPSINIYNYSYCQSLAFKNRQYLLIHESGHAINWRNPRVQQSFVSNAWNNDSACYQSEYLKTYPLRCGGSCGISPTRESFAEAIADYVMCSGGGTCQYAGAGNAYSQPIYDFPSACPVTNNWTGSNVY
ncbi:MAG: hypothetical protein M1444_04435 [Patescibacteria group bacterium]|nr:hypothetical protein [Patescibacteria group bacterium]